MHIMWRLCKASPKQRFLLSHVRAFRIGKSPRRDEIFLVPIESLDKQGNGVTTIEWDTMQKQIEPTKLVVRGALPGETVRVRVISVFAKSGLAIHTVSLNVFGRRERLIRPRLDSEPWRSSLEPELLPAGHQESPDLIPFACPHFSRRHDDESCRGCTVPHLNYTRQIDEKTKLLKAALSGAVDSSFPVVVEPRSQIDRFASKVEVFAFSKRPLETPEWGQLSFKDPLPGERRNKHFIPTPECRLMSKSAKVVLNRLSELVQVAHETSPGLFSVYDEILNRGFLRSTILQSAKSKDGSTQVLLTIVTATEPSPRFRELVKSEVADRLMAEFPLLKGVLLQQASVSPDRDAEYFADTSKRLVLAGEERIHQFVESQQREIAIGPETNSFDPEVQSKLVESLIAAIGDRDEPVVEFFSGDHSITSALREMSSHVTSLSSENVSAMLEAGIVPSQVGEPLLIPSGESGTFETPPMVVNESHRAMVSADENEKVAVISYPPDNGKADIKGVTSKDFRHWLGNVVKPQKIVIITDKFDGLRKDIGHMKLLGYELLSIRAVDAQPGQMHRIATIVVMQRKPRYQDLTQDQLIE